MVFLSSKTEACVSVVLITFNKLSPVLIRQGKTYGGADISVELCVFVQVKRDWAYEQVIVGKCGLWLL